MKNKIVSSFLASALFVVLLLIIYYVHIEYFQVDVVFYSAISDGVFASAVASIFLYCLKYFNRLGNFEKSLLVVVWLLIGYSFAISVPTVLDRSLSFYILEKLDQRGGGIKKSAIGDIFKNEYMKEHHLVDVRLTEQLESGTIVIRNDCVKLTKRGRYLVKFSEFYRRHLLPKKRLLMGVYTDDLTDIFRNSDKVTDYVCK